MMIEETVGESLSTFLWRRIERNDEKINERILKVSTKIAFENEKKLNSNLIIDLSCCEIIIVQHSF